MTQKFDGKSTTFLPGRRINVRGNSGSGKTTFAARLAEILEIPHVELDALFWKPNWQKPTDEEFHAKIKAALDRPTWVVDGNYRVARPVLDPLVDTIVWLDYPFHLVFRRVFIRTIQRGWKNELLWGHCQERLVPQFTTRDSILWWTIKTHCRRRRECRKLQQDPPPGVQVIVFRHPREAEAYLQTLKTTSQN